MLDAEKLEYEALKTQTATAFSKVAMALRHPNVTQEQYEDLAKASESLTHIIRRLAKLKELLEKH